MRDCKSTADQLIDNAPAERHRQVRSPGTTPSRPSPQGLPLVRRIDGIAALFEPNPRRGTRKRWLIAAKARTVRDVPISEHPVAPKCQSIEMTTRSRRETVHFRHPFRIRGIDRLLPPGGYEVVTDDEMIEGLSFPSFRRVATMIMVPCAAPRQSSTEMISINSIDLSDAQRIDASASHD
jgi:hypothetical protein